MRADQSNGSRRSSTAPSCPPVSVQEESPGRWLGAQSSSRPWFTRQMDDPGFLCRTGTEGEPQTATLWKCWEQQGPPASNWTALPGTIGQAGEEGECGRVRITEGRENSRAG